MERHPELRAGDADREHAAADLREHFAAGRLSEAELAERLDATYAATTVGALDALRADLPDPRPLPAPPSARSLARRRIYQDAGAVVIIGCIAVWAATGANGSFWPIWVMLLSGLDSRVTPGDCSGRPPSLRGSVAAAGAGDGRPVQCDGARRGPARVARARE